MNKKYVYTSFFVLVLIVISLLFFKIISPFIMDIFLALLLTHFFFPIKRRLARKFNEKVSGIITITSIIFIVVIPLTVIGAMVSSEISILYDSTINNWPEVQDKILNHEYFKDVSSIPIIGTSISPETKNDVIGYIGQTFTELAKYSFVFIKSFVLNLTSTAFHFLFTLLFTFYLLVDHDKAKGFMNHIIPLDQENIDEIYNELENTGNATIKGTFLIGLIEGTFGALLLTFVGMNSGVLWGVIMFVLSMIPLIGITIVLIPFSIFLFFTGDVSASIIVLTVGILGVTFTQNILKPKLVGDASGLHQGIVLVSSLGGISFFGITGFILGPLIATMFFVIWKQFALKYEV